MAIMNGWQSGKIHSKESVKKPTAPNSGWVSGSENYTEAATKKFARALKKQSASRLMVIDGKPVIVSGSFSSFDHDRG